MAQFGVVKNHYAFTDNETTLNKFAFKQIFVSRRPQDHTTASCCNALCIQNRMVNTKRSLGYSQQANELHSEREGEY